MTAHGKTPAPAPRTPAVCFEGVAFSYDGARVLEAVDFDVYAGEFACMVGPNGGGKTTLLKLAVGELTPTEGRVRVFGEAPRAVRRPFRPCRRPLPVRTRPDGSGAETTAPGNRVRRSVRPRPAV